MTTLTPSILDSFSLSTPQQTAVLARGGDVAVTAGAGTGKTRTLVARTLALLNDGTPLRQIVAVTFTRKAAREMRNRVRQEIGTYLATDLSPDESQRWQTLYNELDAARIGTIHNLCGEILRAHPAEAGIDPRFAVLDETQAALLVQETVEASLVWAVEQPEMTPLLGLLRERPLQALIATLLSKQQVMQTIMETLPADTIYATWQAQLETRQAVALDQMLTAPAFVTAVACLRRNEATSSDDKQEIQRRMVLTSLDFDEDASLADKLRNLFTLEEIKLTGGSMKNWPDGKEQLAAVKEALKTMRDLYRAQPALQQRLNAQDEAVAAAMPAIYALCQYAQRAYQAKKGERDALDFDDLETLSSHLLFTQPAIRSYWQGQIQALLVDEFQDTNEQQRQFIRQLCPQSGKLFIVGDAKQSIYRFRGADVTVFATEKKRIAADGGHLIDLSTSYRAHETLLTDMNNLLSPILGEAGPQLPPWATPFAPLAPGGKPVAPDMVPPFVEIHLGVGNKPEALPVAASALALRLAHLHQIHGLDYGVVAILCRASSAFQYYENALDAAGIPYLTVAGRGFYDRPEIRDLLNGLQAIADPHDDLALVGLLRSPACGLSDVSLYHLAAQRPEGVSLWAALQDGLSVADMGEASKLETAVSLIGDLNQQAGRIPAADIFKQFLDRTKYRAILRRIDQPRALRNVAKLLTDIHNSELISITEFLEYAQLLRDSGSREGEARATAGGAVQIMSIHAAKGLEFPVVVLGDAGSGSNRASGILIDPQLGLLLPTKNADEVQAASYQLGADLAKQQEEAEKARLLYVALTRAEQMLLISGTATLTKMGQLSCKSWLGQLADITGLADVDLSGYNEEGDGQHLFESTLAETAVRTVVYEPHIVPLLALPEEAVLVEGEGEAERPLLQDSLLTAEAVAALGDGTPERVWQVVPTAKRPEAPAWVIGSLVHEALALWRFPDPGFETWLTARAREYGLTDASQLGHAQVETTRFLRRFQAHRLYQEIASANRRLHEVPYSYERDGVTETGYIDLLYQRDGLWTLVDFKTDRARTEADFQKLLMEKGYQAQVGRYGTAVLELMGIIPRLLLCFLNVENDVRIIES